MPVLVRAMLYASIFVGLVLLYVPSRLLSGGGITRPGMGAQQIAGLVIGTIGAAVMLWSVISFVRLGQGTPAPFDPPRRLVTRGPYRYVRNPMYIGAGLALIGAAWMYGSWLLLSYVGLLFLLTQAFVRFYEEPTLRKTFGEEYQAYCARVGRWWPR
jgi:protein-S-isoprenylcysteine O-methyltransferase Ste14